MRQHVLQVGKSQDTYHGIMGMRRILQGPTGRPEGGWRITLRRDARGAWQHVRREGPCGVIHPRWAVRGTAAAVGGVRRSLCPVASAPGQLPLRNPPLGALRMA